MSIRRSAGKPETAGSRASPGEPVRSGAIIGAAGDRAGASEPSEEALKFILVAGCGGHHHHPAEKGLRPPPGGSGVVFLGVLRRQLALRGPETVNRNQVRMNVWRLLPDAPGQWRGHRPKTGVVIVSPVAALLRGRSRIPRSFRVPPMKSTFSGLQRWTSASPPAKSLLRKQRSLLVFSQVFG